MEQFADASGPTYPYSYPLPDEARAEHLRATVYYQREINLWGWFALIPGNLCLVLVTQYSDEDGLLWESDLPVAVSGLLLGLFLVTVGWVQVSLALHAKHKHSKLLKAYDVRLDLTDTVEVAPLNHTIGPDLEKIREDIGKPLPGYEVPPPPVLPPRRVDDFSGGVIRLSPPTPAKHLA